MRGYETCVIIHPDMSEENIEALLNKLGESISNFKGTALKTEKWGKKKLLYPIKKQHRGNYCILSYLGNEPLLNEINHILKFNENVLRFQTVRIENSASLASPAQPPEQQIEEHTSSNVQESDTPGEE